MQLDADAIRPVEISQVGQESLVFRWADGKIITYPLALLRRGCSCAGCRQQGDQRARDASPFKVLKPAPSELPASIEQAGNYAIAITWNDQHYSIFAFDHLRQIGEALLSGGGDETG